MERVEAVVERLGNQVATDLGYELVEVEYRKEGPDWVLRCTIDSLEGIGTDDCQQFSQALEVLLDIHDPIPGQYLLEVSSPGIERPLKKDHDFQRFSGHKVEIRLHKALNNQKVFQGQLLGLFDNGDAKIVKLKIKDLLMEIPRSQIAKANLSAEIFGQEGGNKRK